MPASLGAISNQTLLITARHAGQWLTVGNTTYIAPADGAEIRAYGTGSVMVGPGWWDKHGVFNGNYSGPYFDGSYTSTVGTDHMAVERSTDGGETWHLVADDVPSESGVADPYAPLFGPLHYRAVAVSALPSVAYGEPVEVIPPEPDRAWFTLEDGRAISLPYNLAMQSTRKPGVELHRLLDRPKPVASFALDYAPDFSVSLSGVVLPERDGTSEAVWADMVLGRHVYYRDPARRAFWGAVTSGLDWKPTWYDQHSVSLTVTEVDHD